MSLTVKLAGVDDAAALAGLVREQDRHYGEGDPGETRALAAVMGWLRADGALGRYAIAYEAGSAVGFAGFAIIHPGHDLSGLLFLKDVFVSEPSRRGGIGAALIRFLAAFCVENGVGRIDFPTDLGNAAAQQFYRRLGAERLEEAGYHRLTGETLRRLATDQA